MFLLKLYPEGISLTIRTQQDFAKWILNLLDATGLLARCRLCSFEFNFDIDNRAGIKNKDADKLVWIEIGRKDCDVINGDLPITIIELNEEKSKAIKASLYNICHICDSKEQETGTTMLAVQDLVQQDIHKWDSPEKLAEFIAARAQHRTCQQYAATFGQPDSKFYVDSSGLLVRQLAIDGAL